MIPRLILLFTTALVLGCGGQTSTDSTSAATKKQPPPASVKKHACGKNQVFKGRVRMEGTLKRTKGGQLMLKGTLVELPVAATQMRAKLSAVNKQWYGKHVVLEGDRCIYYCEPGAQCLRDGAIPSLRNVKILKGKQ